MILRHKHVKALQRAVAEAACWRGNLIGNPDPYPLEEFDKHIATAREALKIVRQTYVPINKRKES
jgi:hypothetical protein